MLRSLLIVSLFVVGATMVDTSDAQAHWRWRRGYYRPVVARRVAYRPVRYYRPYYGPRVRVGVGVGIGYGYYGW